MEASGRPLGRVAILGLGVMGGSLARGLSTLDLAERVTGWSPRSTERDAALTAGAVGFAAADWRDAVSDADLVVMAIPLAAVVDLLPEVLSATPGEATVTDVASLKSPPARAAAASGAGERWIGSHPMVGSEASGFWASRPDLYEGARVWTVTGAGSDPSTAKEDDGGGAPDLHRSRVEDLWRGLGAVPAAVAAEDHDRLMELVSHLPQLVSNVLARVLLEAGVDPVQLGPGGRDMTRLAASNPLMWLDLLEHASGDLAEALRALGEGAREAADLVERGDLEGLGRLMQRTRDWQGAS